MTELRFFKLLFGSILLAVILSEGIIYFLADQGVRLFGLLGVIFFAIFCQVFYVLAKKAARSNSPNAFIRLSIINVFAKIFLVFIFVGIFYKMSTPAPHKFFLLPFLSSYLVFLCFETYFMFVLANNKTTN